MEVGDGRDGQHAELCRFLSSSWEGCDRRSAIRGSGSPPAECSIVSCPLNRRREAGGLQTSFVALLPNSKGDGGEQKKHKKHKKHLMTE